MHRASVHFRCVLLLLTLCAGVWGCGGNTPAASEDPVPEAQTDPATTPAATGPAPAVVYTPTTGITRTGNPARADYAGPDSWVLCSGTFALCYYSGPEPAEGQPDLSCVITQGPEKMANCNCLHFDDQDYWVDMDGILDRDTYDATIDYCEVHDCASPTERNQAPVCQAINGGTLFEGVTADSISTFSPTLSVRGTPYWIEPTDCPRGKYAGCMTAPCVASDLPPVEINGTTFTIDVCTCPTWTEEFFVGSPIDQTQCQLGSGDPGTNVWSAATNEVPAHIVVPGGGG